MNNFTDLNDLLLSIVIVVFFTIMFAKIFYKKLQNRLNCKSLEAIELIFTFISVIIIGFSSVYVSLKANDIAKMNTCPYFEIYTINKEDRQNGYKIINKGGYIQDAEITLKSIINVYVTNFGGENFNFIYEKLTETYSDLKDNEIIFEFGWKDFGINNWGYNNQGVIKMLSKELEAKLIISSINYMEILNIKYMDVNRIAHDEQYWVGINEDGTLFLSLISEDTKNSIYASLIDRTDKELVDYNDRTIIEIGNSGVLGAGRKYGTDYTFVLHIIETIDEYMKKIDINLTE